MTTHRSHARRAGVTVEEFTVPAFTRISNDTMRFSSYSDDVNITCDTRVCGTPGAAGPAIVIAPPVALAARPVTATPPTGDERISQSVMELVGMFTHLLANASDSARMAGQSDPAGLMSDRMAKSSMYVWRRRTTSTARA
jgi:hypothetical protein